MAVNLKALREVFNPETIRYAMAREDERRSALTPEMRAAEDRSNVARQERVRRHIAFLDYCVAKKIDPNLVLPVSPKK